MTKKILIVDDEPDMLTMLNARLKSSGFHVIEARNGEEAIMLANKELPNLIILDILMPDIDGGEVAEILGQNEATKDIPIIFLTGLYTKQDERQGPPIKKHVFVAKPFDTQEFLEIVRKNIM